MEEVSKSKNKRYPPAHGKSVVRCSVETWGRLGGVLDNLLLELHGLAQRRQRDRGISPTNWLLRWRTLISVHLAMGAGRAIFDSVSKEDKINVFHLRSSQHFDLVPNLNESIVMGWREEDSYPGGGRLNTLTSDVTSGGQST